MYEDTYRIRQLNEMKVQHETQTIDLLKKCLNESEDNTNRMNSLLNNFETRLTSLHDLIVPIYDATNTLQIKHSNINKTVSKLDNIIEYYNSVKNLSLVIQAGPGKDINTYISQLNKLRLAIDYFEANKNQSQKKQNEELWLQGKLNVDREFDILLSKFSDSALAIIEKDNDIDDNNQKINAKTLNLKENDMNQLISIINWFKQVEPSYLDKLYEKLIRVRNQLSLDKLKKMAEKSGPSTIKQKNNLLNPMSTGQSSSMNRSKSIAPSSSSSSFNQLLAAQGEKSSLRNRLADNLLNSSEQKRKKSMMPLNGSLNDSGLSTNSNRSASLIPQNRSACIVPGMGMIETDFEPGECMTFLHCVRKSLKMFYIESIFIGEIFDTNQKVILHKILERIFDPVLRFLKEEAEKLATNMKQITSKLTSKYVISMFSVLQHLVRMKPEFMKVFEESLLITKTSCNISNSIEQFLEIFITIEKACSTTLKDIIEEIKNDPSSVQPNGNIHAITTEVITFIKNLLPYDLIAGLIANTVVSENKHQMLPSEVEINLRRDSSRASNSSKFTQIAYQNNSETEMANYRIAMSEYFYKLFRWLNLNLKNKAENYENQQNLKWIFLLNNSYRISKLFSDSNSLSAKKKRSGKCDNVDELFLQTGKRDLKLFYDTEILNFKREYSKCWSKLLSYIRDLNEHNPFTDSKMKEKERQLLKDKFSGFNKEFEEIYETQKRFYIPAEQTELAEILRQDNTIYIISQYKRFYDTYARLNFATNRDKYVKYAPEELAAKIREFFSAN